MNLSAENLQTLLTDYAAYQKARAAHPRLKASVGLVGHSGGGERRRVEP